MAFLKSLGNFLGNALGINQADAAQAARESEQQAVQSLQEYGNQTQEGSNRALRYTQAGLGESPTETLQKSYAASMPIAKQIAEQTGNAAGRQTQSMARTAGLNKGQAALEGGQAGGNAAAAAMPGALGQEQGLYMGGIGAGEQLQGQTGGQTIGAYGGAGGTSQAQADTQGKQGMLGFGTLGNIAGSAATHFGMRGAKEGGIFDEPVIAGEAGPEIVIPVRKILKRKPRELAEILKIIKPEVEKTTKPKPEESSEPSIDDLIKRIEALEGMRV